MDFNVKQRQYSKEIEKGLIPLNTETLCLLEDTKVINKQPVKTSLQSIVTENNVSKIPSSFHNKFEHISVSRKLEAAKFDPEITFENNIL